MRSRASTRVRSTTPVLTLNWCCWLAQVQGAWRGAACGAACGAAMRWRGGCHRQQTGMGCWCWRPADQFNGLSVRENQLFGGGGGRLRRLATCCCRPVQGFQLWHKRCGAADRQSCLRHSHQRALRQLWMGGSGGVRAGIDCFPWPNAHLNPMIPAQ